MPKSTDENKPLPTAAEAGELRWTNLWVPLPDLIDDKGNSLPPEEQLRIWHNAERAHDHLVNGLDGFLKPLVKPNG